MSTNLIYPSLDQLVSPDKIPTVLGQFENAIQNALASIYYRDFILSRSPKGDSAFYKITLILNTRLGIEVPGTGGLALVLNPDYQSGLTEIPLSISYRLLILSYIDGVKVSEVVSDPQALFNFFLKLSKTNKVELIFEVLQVFISDPDPILNFVSNYNSQRSPAITPITDDDLRTVIADLVSQIESNHDSFEIILNDYILSGLTIENIITNLKLLFKKWFGEFDVETLKELFIPKASFSIDNIDIALEFPRSVFVPVQDGNVTTIPPTAVGDPLPDPYKTLLTFNVVSIKFSTEEGFEFIRENTFDFKKSFILRTKFTLELDDLKLDLSRTKNIPEAIADGRPEDFIGVYIKDGTVGFPNDWHHNEGASTGELKVKNLLAGTGGLSGTIALQGKPTTTPDPNHQGQFLLDPVPLITLTFGSGFIVTLDLFSLTLHQNAITECKINGSMLIPGFEDGDGHPAWVHIEILIGQGEEFKITASVDKPFPLLTIPDVFSFDIKTLFGGKNADGRFYIGVSGDIDFLLQDPIGKFLPDKLDIKKMIIYDDGKYEFEGGSIHLPKAYDLQLGPAKIGVTAIHMGAFEKESRKYKYFGFDGGINVNPGGVDAKGKGIKYYYTVDGPYTSGHEFKWFVRLESLAIDIYIPGGGKPEDAAVIIKGFLSIKDPAIPSGAPNDLKEVLKNSTEYSGGVFISIPKFKGLEASASMRMTPAVPAFIIDLGIEISTPILLGTTGLGIYGFRAIFGKRYVATKEAALIPPEGEWWQYYKAKIDPDYKEGIQISKFSIQEGFSVGAGVSLATSSDSGKVFSSKLFFLLSLPDVFLFQGQAQFLKERIKLDANPDPPFFAIIAITKHSIEAGFGINYKCPDNGDKIGKLVTVDGITELGFFFGNSAAWYFNIGRETPDSYRIQARLFDILNMYFYFMISNSGIRAGAGVNFELKKSFGPLSAELSAYLDTKGKIAFRPKQIGGAIQMGGTVALKICGFGFSVSGGATLAAEAPKPHIITGEFVVCVKVLRKERSARFEFTWNFDNVPDTTRNPVLGNVPIESDFTELDDLYKVAKANHMVTGETMNLAVKLLFDGPSSPPLNYPPIPDPDTWIINPLLDDYRVSVDSFIDIEFKKGLNVSGTTGNLDMLGGSTSPSLFIDYVPPQRGYSDRVRHEYFLENIEILYWDKNSNTWEDYNFYDALIPMFPGTEQVGTLIDPTILKNMKWGYWQQQRPGYNNKLRILATTPLDYAAKTGGLPIEDLGINGDTIFCPGDEIPKTCIVFEKDQVYKNYPANVLNTYKGFVLKITTQDGIVLNVPYLGVDNGLFIQPGNTIEMFFKEPMKFVNLLINSGAPSITVGYYKRITVFDLDGHEILSSGLPVFQYDLIESIIYTKPDWSSEISYTNANKNIDYVKIATINCYQKPDEPREITCLKIGKQIDTRIKELQNFITTLIKTKHFTSLEVQLNQNEIKKQTFFSRIFSVVINFLKLFFKNLFPFGINPQNANIYNGVYMGTGLYPNTNDNSVLINLLQGYISGTTLLFTISDNSGFNCNYSFELVKPFTGFNYANIVSVISIMPYTSSATAGINYYFLIKVKVKIKGIVREVDLLGKSCLPLSYCYDKCNTALYRVCYLSYADYLLNQTIPTDEQQYANNQTMLNGINKTLQPIWSPNTNIAIRLITSDRLYRESDSLPMKSYYLDMVYGFKTAGPVGHYHNYPVDNTPEVEVVHQKFRKDFQQLVSIDRPDDFKLTSLKYYIDYNKSYPNADGDIINAKPLFYTNAELRLFYLYNYVYEFYNDWVDTNPSATNPYIAKSSLDVIVRDPEDSGIPEVNPTLAFVGNSISHINPADPDPENPSLPPVNINSINNNINTLNNILLNGNPCADYTPLAPIDISTKKTLDLKPLKIYTAQFIAKYNPLINGNYAIQANGSLKDYESLVHTYVFQTSRYRSFEEQVNSYILKKDDSGLILKEAVFVLKAKTVNNILDLGLAKNVITNNESDILDKIKLQYADQFDRLINGVLHIDYNKLHAAVTTEFNIIIHPNPDPIRVIGILICNLEPYNDPKLPRANPNMSSIEPTETLEVSKWNGSSWDDPNDFYIIHSKDRSRMFVTERNFNFNIDHSSKLKFKFRYKLYDGVGYNDVSIIDVEINLNSYFI